MDDILSRWQFGTTITYHFLFVPLTIGLALLVAVMQTLAYRMRDTEWERLSRFFGTLFLINFAMGVVTGIVQQFQFGMNWSNYSIFVGNIFGAPLAKEGLLAFFAESTFIELDRVAGSDDGRRGARARVRRELGGGGPRKRIPAAAPPGRRKGYAAARVKPS